MKTLNTNFWDVLVTLTFLTYVIVAFGATAFLIEFHKWSPWWMLGTLLVVGTTSIRTGHAMPEETKAEEG